jgi:hypothetical protein
VDLLIIKKLLVSTGAQYNPVVLVQHKHCGMHAEPEQGGHDDNCIHLLLVSKAVS